MRIGFLVGKFSNGGGERMQNMLMQEFARRHHIVNVYTWNSAWASYNNPLSYNICILPNPPKGLGKYKAYKVLRTKLREDSPDCLIVFSLALAEVGVFSAKSVGVPCICSERVDPHVLPTSHIHRFLKNVTYRVAAGVIFQTEQVKNYFSKQISRKGVVIPNPVMDDGLPQPALDCRKEVVAVGRLSEEKNFALLIEAFYEALPHMEGYKLKIYGDGPLYGELSKLIVALGLEERVCLEGRVERVVDYLCGADIFVLSSNHEGMPNALIEGMAMGLACVSTDFLSGGARAIVTDRKNGMLIPVNDKEALKKALVELATNSDLKKAIKHNAVNIRVTHSKERILPMWIAYIESFKR